MVMVVVERRGDLRSLSMEGHAGYNQGNDIVCAGCSALAYALMGWIANASEHIEDIDELFEDSGCVRIRAQGDGYYGSAFDLTVIGLMQIAKMYPENVRVEER